MRTDNATSEPSSARTSGDGARESERDREKDRERDLANDPKAAPTADRPQRLHPESSEADFLQLQQEYAKEAIGRVLGQLKGDLVEGLNPVPLAKKHPYATIGATAAIGLVAAYMFIPSREERALRKLARIERALNPPPPRKARREEENLEVDGQSGGEAYKAGKSGFMTTLMGEVLKAVRPAVVSLLTAGVTAKAAKPSHEEMKAAAAAEDQEQPGASVGSEY